MPEHLKCRNEGLGWILGGIFRRLTLRFSVDPAVGWVKPVVSACSTLTKKDADIILATGSPFVSFRLARALSAKLACPYVLDYRDPWTGNPHYSGHPIPQSVIREEESLLSSCAAAVTVSPSWALDLAKRFGVGSKLHVVTNGYDLEELKEVKPYDFGHFAIVYAGNFYPPKRVIGPVMAALQRLKAMPSNRGCDWYFHYYGHHGDPVREEAERFNVTDKVVLHGLVPWTQSLSAVKGASVAVVITTVDDEITLKDQGIVPGKIFETVGLGIPMLLIAPPGSDVTRILEPTNLARSFTARDIAGMAHFLSDMMSGRSMQGKNTHLYSWPSLAGKLDAILKEALGGNSRQAQAG
jgi:glycosyltransferase involved in cell wall biosynthesis